jgi:hypothetical protein
MNDISKVSVFRLPVFDPEKEMQKLKDLWKKRWPNESLSPPVIARYAPRSKTRVPEPSFFESDSDSEDEAVSPRSYLHPAALRANPSSQRSSQRDNTREVSWGGFWSPRRSFVGHRRRSILSQSVIVNY